MARSRVPNLFIDVKPRGKVASRASSAVSSGEWLSARVTEVLAGGWLEVELPADDPQTVATGPSDGGVTQVGAIVRVLRDSSGRITQIGSPTEVDTSEDAAPVVSMGATGDMIASAMSDAAEAFAQAEVVKSAAQAAFDKAEQAASDLAAQKAKWQATADKVGTLAGTVEGLGSKITDAQSVAAKAGEDAAAAQKAADDAKAAAAAAQTAAVNGTAEAKAAADAAASKADAANNLANTAKTDASTAQAAADAAKTQAATATSSADKAQAAATASKATADSAAATATAAQAAAVAAQARADAAKATADSATSAADAAATAATAVNLVGTDFPSRWAFGSSLTRTAAAVVYAGGETGQTATSRTYGRLVPAAPGAAFRLTYAVTNTGASGDVTALPSLMEYNAASRWVYYSVGTPVTVAAGATQTFSQVFTVKNANAAQAIPAVYLWGLGSASVTAASMVDVSEAVTAQKAADDAAAQAVAAKNAADAAAASALGAQATADAAAAKASTASGLYTVAAADPATSDGVGKPAGAIWEVRSGGTSLRRYVWGGSSWTQIKAGQDFIGPKAIGRAQIGDAAIGTAQVADAAITDAKIGNLSVSKLAVTGGATIPVAVIDALVSDQAFLKDVLAQKIVVSGDPTNKVGTINMEDGAVTASKIYASEELWAKLAAFGAVTTDMLTAGKATITGDAVVGTLTGNKLVAGDSASTATVGPLSSTVFGAEVESARNGKATLGVRSSGPYLQFKDGAGAETFYVDGDGNFRMKDRVRGGTVSLDNYLSSWTFSNNFGQWYFPNHTDWSWEFFLGTQFRVMSPTGKLRIEHRLMYEEAKSVRAAIDIQMGLYTKDPSSQSGIGTNLFGSVAYGLFSARIGEMIPSFTGAEIVNVTPNTWYWARAVWRRQAANSGTLRLARYWSQIQPV